MKYNVMVKTYFKESNTFRNKSAQAVAKTTVMFQNHFQLSFNLI